LTHGVVVERLLAKRIAFGQAALEASALVDRCISFLDVVENRAWIPLLDN